MIEMFILFREFVSNNVYPTDWMVMTMVQNRFAREEREGMHVGLLLCLLLAQVKLELV